MFGDFRAFLPQQFSTATILATLLQHAFAAGDALHVAGGGDGHGDGAGESLEDGFQAVMVIIAIEEFHVQVHAGVFAKALEEVFDRSDRRCRATACGP